MTGYQSIHISGGDTGQPLTVNKRLAVLARYVHEVDQGKTFLDCGCGAGSYVLAIMHRFGLDAHGVEYSAKKVEQAGSNPELQGRILQGDITQLNFASDSIDYALLNEVLEHVPDERSVLDEIYRVLKPGGYLFVFSPNRFFPIETHSIELKHSKRRLSRLVPFIPYIPLSVGNRIFNYWARNYWPWELARLVRQSRFHVLDRGSVAMTFSNGSLRQPKIVGLCAPALRVIGDTMEKLPVLKYFGMSQFLVCQK